MELHPSVTERTTAATDLLLVVAALAGIWYLRRATPGSTARRIWLAALAAAAAASLLGAVAHGLLLSPALREILWQPLFLLLGVVVACFATGAVADTWGASPARRLLPPMLVLAVLFYVVTRLSGGDFLVFVLFQAAGLLAALGIYVRLALRGRAGAGLVAAALAVSLAAGAVQADETLSARVVWPLDHNGLYHLVQLAGLALLVAGLARTLRAAPRDPA